jgi:hypothetical protein
MQQYVSVTVPLKTQFKINQHSTKHERTARDQPMPVVPHSHAILGKYHALSLELEIALDPLAFSQESCHRKTKLPLEIWR